MNKSVGTISDKYQNENGDWEGGCSTHHCSNDECNYNCLGMNDCDDSISNCSDCVSTNFGALENYVNNNEFEETNYMSYLFNYLTYSTISI